jgi:hypothetical protein
VRLIPDLIRDPEAIRLLTLVLPNCFSGKALWSLRVRNRFL